MFNPLWHVNAQATNKYNPSAATRPRVASFLHLYISIHKDYLDKVLAQAAKIAVHNLILEFAFNVI